MKPHTDILQRILETKLDEIESLKDRVVDLREAAENSAPTRDFMGSLSEGESVAVIAELKRRSPGAGPIRMDLDPLQIAPSYEAGGAAALSVLTDQEYFNGSLDDLITVRRLVSLPILRKDFVVHESQVYESRAGGADAILLIVRILDDIHLRSLRILAEDLGMAALVEVHDETEMDRGVAAGARLLGINNRNLRTFKTDLEVTINLLDRVPPDVVLVSESGICKREDVSMLGNKGVDAVLVGESLLRQEDPGAGVSDLAGEVRRIRGDG